MKLTTVSAALLLASASTASPLASKDKPNTEDASAPAGKRWDNRIFGSNAAIGLKGAFVALQYIFLYLTLILFVASLGLEPAPRPESGNYWNLNLKRFGEHIRTILNCSFLTLNYHLFSEAPVWIPRSC